MITFRKVLQVVGMLSLIVLVAAWQQGNFPSGAGFPVTTPVTVGTGGVLSTTGTGQINATTAKSTPIVTSGLLAQYPMTEGSGAVLNDVSGNANNATLCATTQAPTWISAAVGGLQFTGSSNQCVNLPVALNGTLTIQIFAGFQSSVLPIFTTDSQVLVGGSGALATSLDFSLISKSTNNGGLRLASLNHSVFAWLSIAQGAFNGNGLLTLTIGAADAYYLNGAPYAISQAGSSTGAQSGGNLVLGSQLTGCAAPCTPFTGQMYYALFYNRQLTAAEVAQNAVAVQSIVSQRGISSFVGGPLTDFNDQIVTDGDSITAGLNWPIYGLAPSQNLNDVGFPGNNCGTNLQNASLNVDTMYRQAALRNTDVIWCGTNEMATPLVSTIAALRGYCQARHIVGWKCLVVTMIDRASESLFHDQYNAQINSVSSQFADGVVDIGANVHLGADGANANTTYFSDTIHLTTYADQFIAGQALVHAVNRVWGNTATSGNYNVYNGTGAAVPQFVQSVVASPVTGSTSAIVLSTGTNGFNTTAGDFLFLNVICQQGCSGLTISGVADGGDTFNAIGSLTALPAGGQAQSFYAMNIAGGAKTVAVTWSGSAANVQLVCNEYSGVALTAALDVNSAIAQANSTALASANVTTTVAGDLLVGFGGSDNGLGAPFSFLAGPGYIMRNSNSGAALEDQIAVTTATINATMTTVSTVNWSMGIAAFKPIASTTSTYNLLDVDIYAECNPAGGNVALNLPDASWMTGQTVTIKNIQTAGANTCIVNGVTPLATGVAQQIDGAATFTVANKATAIFKSKLTFTGVAGTNLSPVSNWIQVN
jgi:hypothetical protein